MTTARRGLPSPARLGLTDQRAGDTLRKLGWRDVADDAPAVLWALSRAPDPDLALRSTERLADALGERWRELDEALRADVGLRGRLLGVLGASRALGDHLVAEPGDRKSVV